MGTLIRMSAIVLFNQHRIPAHFLQIIFSSFRYISLLLLSRSGPPSCALPPLRLSAYRMGTPIRMSAIVLFNQQRIRDRQKRDQLAEAFRKADKVSISHKKSY